MLLSFLALGTRRKRQRQEAKGKRIIMSSKRLWFSGLLALSLLALLVVMVAVNSDGEGGEREGSFSFSMRQLLSRPRGWYRKYKNTDPEKYKKYRKEELAKDALKKAHAKNDARNEEPEELHVPTAQELKQIELQHQKEYENNKQRKEQLGEN